MFGEPVNNPLLDSDSQLRSGLLLVFSVHVTVPVAPATLSCWLYGTLIVALGKVVVVTTGGPTTIVNEASATCADAPESVTSMVKVNVPDCLGDPVIVPATASRDRPPGIAPDASVHR